MKENRRSLIMPILATALLGLTVSARADFFFQPSSSPIENEWRMAGSVFLNAVAQITNGLAAIEGRDPSSAQRAFETAGAYLGKAWPIYTGIQSHIQRPRAIKIPADQLGRVEGLFKRYGIKPPTDESQAAAIAGSEAEGLARMLEKEPNAPELLAQMIRVLQLGTVLSELMRFES